MWFGCSFVCDGEAKPLWYRRLKRLPRWQPSEVTEKASNEETLRTERLNLPGLRRDLLGGANDVPEKEQWKYADTGERLNLHDRA